MTNKQVVDQYDFFNKTGFQLIDASDLTKLVNSIQLATGGNPITALAGGGLAGAPQLRAALNRVSVVANNNDSVALPPAVPGIEVFVDNDGASTLAVFAQTANPNNAGGGADLIVAAAGLTAAAAASVTQASAKGAWYICTTPGYWKQVLGG